MYINEQAKKNQMANKNKILISANPDKYNKTWKDFNKVINGKFTFDESIYANVDGPIYKFEIVNTYKEIEFIIEQAIIIRPFRNDLFKPLTFRLRKENTQVINLSMWIKDWSDRIFGFQKIRTGNSDFDNIYCLKGKDKNKIIGLFNSALIRKGFLNDKNLIFNIKTENNYTNIELKKVGLEPDKDELNRMYNLFRELIKEMKFLDII